jgi:rhomboid protease GluP
MVTPDSSPPVIDEFEIRYGPLRGSPANSLKLRGDGKLRLYAESIELTGSAGTLFRKERAVSMGIPFDRIINVQQAERAVGFEILPGNAGDSAPPARVVVLLPDEPAARRLAARLPAMQTPEFQKVTREQSEFVRRLRAVSPHAPVTRALVGVNAVVFAAMVMAGAGLVDPDPDVHLQWGSNFGPLTLHGEWWRLLTSTVIHFGILHLALNMWALWTFGDVTERLFGSTRFALLYVIAGVAGSIASVLWNPLANSAGASGAVFGVFGGMLAFLTRRDTGVPMSIVVTHRNQMLVLVAINLVLGFTHPAIDNAAHVGGLVAGFIAGLALASPVDPARRAQRQTLRVLAIAIAAFATLAFLFVFATQRLTPESQLRMSLAWLSHYEADAVDRYERIMRALPDDSGEMLRQIESDVLPFWNEAARRLDLSSGSEDSEVREFQEALQEYIEQRRDAIATLAEGLRESSPRLLRESQFEWNRSQRALAKVNEMPLPESLQLD